MDPLATLEQLTARMTAAPDATRAGALLVDASAKVRDFTGQTISADASTSRFIPRRGRIVLPQWPVVSVDGAVDDLGDAVDVTWPTTGWGLEVVQAYGPTTITYTHGWATVPDIVVAVVCQMVGRALGMPSSSTGVQSESLGEYSYSVGAAAAAGPLGMLADERAALLRFRRPAHRPISVLL